MEQAKICQLFKKFGKCPLGKNCKLSHPQQQIQQAPKPESSLDSQIIRIKKRFMSSFELLVHTSGCVGFRIKVKPNFDIFKYNIVGDPENFSMELHIYVEVAENQIIEKKPVLIIPQNIPQHFSEAITCAAVKLIQFPLNDLLKLIQNHCETILDFVLQQAPPRNSAFAPWSPTEQLKLQFALEQFPVSQQVNDDLRWRDIAQIVWSRNPKECEQRVKDLKEDKLKADDQTGKEPSQGQQKVVKEQKQQELTNLQDLNQIQEQDEEVKQKVPLTQQQEKQQKTVINVLKHSWNKYEVSVSGYTKIQALRLDAKCQNCNHGLEITLTHQSKITDQKENKLLISTSECNSCNEKIIAIFSPKVIHSFNTTNAGLLVTQKAKPFDILPSNFQVMCEACMEDPPLIFKKCKHHTLINDHCRQCHQELKLKFLSMKLRRGLDDEPDFTDLVQCKKRIVQSVKTKAKGFTKGKPLPMNGTCKHYKRSFRWFRFSCCGKLFPCDQCHNLHEEHKNETAKLMVCGYCSDQQPFQLKLCRSCKRDLTGEVQQKAKHWEGGKGQRDKQKMSTKDSHKYKGMNKTISNRAKKT